MAGSWNSGDRATAFGLKKTECFGISSPSLSGWQAHPVCDLGAGTFQPVTASGLEQT